MLQSINHLHGFSIHAEDGEIGSIDDLYFDDGRWTIRYLVVDTGKWLPGRLVLISPASAKAVDWTSHTISVDLTRDQVKNSPDAAADEPVSRQYEEELRAHYGWPAYWIDGAFGFAPMTVPMPPPEPEPAAAPGDPHLRSAREVKGYHLEAVDGAIGHVSDFVFDDTNWEMAFLIVDTGSWLHKRLVLLRPNWVKGIDWVDRRVTVDLTREAIQTSPPFSPVFPISSEYAEQLIKHYHGIGDA